MQFHGISRVMPSGRYTNQVQPNVCSHSEHRCDNIIWERRNEETALCISTSIQCIFFVLPQRKNIYNKYNAVFFSFCFIIIVIPSISHATKWPSALNKCANTTRKFTEFIYVNFSVSDVMLATLVRCSSILICFSLLACLLKKKRFCYGVFFLSQLSFW